MPTDDISQITSDYATLTLWESGEQTQHSSNAVTADKVVIAECGDFAITDNFAMSGWTVDSTHYLHVRGVGAGIHTGRSRDATGTGFQISDSVSGSGIIRTAQNFCRVENINVKNTHTGTQSCLFSGTGTDLLISRCILQSASTDTGVAGGITAIGNNISVRNTILYGGTCRGFELRGLTGATVYFCTLQGGGSHGLLMDAGTARNNWVGGYSTECFFTAGTTCSNNAGTDASPDDEGGASSINSLTASNQFTTVATDNTANFHLKAGNVLDGAGVTVAGISVDIDGETRASTPSISADETISAATAKWFLRANSSTGGFQEMIGGFDA